MSRDLEGAVLLGQLGAPARYARAGREEQKPDHKTQDTKRWQVNSDSDRRLHTRNNKNLKLCFSSFLNKMGGERGRKKKKKKTGSTIHREEKKRFNTLEC